MSFYLLFPLNLTARRVMGCKTDSARFTLYEGSTGYSTVHSLDQTPLYAQWIDVYQPSHDELQSLANVSHMWISL